MYMYSKQVKKTLQEMLADMASLFSVDEIDSDDPVIMVVVVLACLFVFPALYVKKQHCT